MSASRIEDLAELAGFDPGTAEDKDLTLAFQRGEDGAYQAIYDRYSGRVHSICRRMLGQRDDAQEAMQETFLKVYQALGKFNGRYQLGPWIARIATNVCLDQLRARTRHYADATPTELLELEPNGNGEAHNPEVVVIRNAEGRRVRKVLAGLPPMHRAAIVLRDFEGLSYEDIGIVLGINECKVKALLHRARKAFRRSWETSALSILLPWRYLQRVREMETSVRDQAGQLLASGGQAAASCSTLLQQCGQYVADRAASVATALVGSVVAISAVAAGPAPPPDASRSVVASSAADDGSPSILAKHLVERKVALKESPTANEDTAEPAPQAPAAEPAPAPEPSPTAAPEPPPSGDGGAAPAPPPAEPSGPPAEPQGFTFAFSSDLPSSAPCACMTPTAMESEAGRGDQWGLESFTQTISGSADAAGTPTYGLDLTHSSDAGGHHSMRFFLWTAEGSYGYAAEGLMVASAPTEWGGWSYTFSGSYKQVSAPTHEQMPLEGTYTATIEFSWRQVRIVSASFSLLESAN